MYQDVHLALCMEIHPRRVGQIVSFELQPMQGSAGAELSKIPVGFLGAGRATASCRNQQGQPWKRQEKFYSSVQGEESDGAMGRLRKHRNAAFNLMDLCPVQSYKIAAGFLFPGDFGGYQLCHHLQFLECGSLQQDVYFVQLETSST